MKYNQHNKHITLCVSHRQTVTQSNNTVSEEACVFESWYSLMLNLDMGLR